MPSPRRSFPTQLVRDLQGLVRLLYRAEQDMDMPDSYGRLGRLEEAGRALGAALDVARKTGPQGKIPVSAWGWTDKGIRILREMVADQPELRELIRVVTMPLESPAPPKKE